MPGVVDFDSSDDGYGVLISSPLVGGGSGWFEVHLGG